jgi:hypothetical protein
MVPSRSLDVSSPPVLQERKARATAAALGHLHRQVKDPILRAKLTPHHEFGCKRPLVLDDYYPTLEKPNVELITNKPVRITEDSIISKPPAALPKEVLEDEPAGAYDEANLANEDEIETKCDVLIWGTGIAVDLTAYIRIRDERPRGKFSDLWCQWGQLAQPLGSKA